MCQQGVEKVFFDIIVVSGWCGVLLYGKVSDKIVVVGEFVIFDFGVLYQGYCFDMMCILLVNGEGVSVEFYLLFNVY